MSGIALPRDYIMYDKCSFNSAWTRKEIAAQGVMISFPSKPPTLNKKDDSIPQECLSSSLLFHFFTDNVITPHTCQTKYEVYRLEIKVTFQ